MIAQLLTIHPGAWEVRHSHHRVSLTSSYIIFAASVIVDVTSHLSPDTLAGAVYLGAAPYMDPVFWGRICNPAALALVPGLISEESAAVVALQGPLGFTECCFQRRSDAPSAPGVLPTDWQTFCAWLGSAAQTFPNHRRWTVMRPQDPAKLFELTKAGTLPALFVHGTEDAVIIGEPMIEEMRPYFKRMEVKMIEKGGNHAVFHENPEEVMESIMSFVKSVHS